MALSPLPIRIEAARGIYSIDTLRRGDEAQLIVLLNTPSIARNLIFPPTPYTQADAEKGIAVANEPIILLNGHELQRRMAIRDQAGLVQGGIGFRSIDDRTVAIGYYLGPETRGQKLMHKVIEALSPFFAGMCIMGSANIGNRGSEQILLESGFVEIPGIDEWVDFPEEKGGGRRPFTKYKKMC